MMVQRIAEYRERYYKSLAGRESLARLIDEAEVPEHVYNSNTYIHLMMATAE